MHGLESFSPIKLLLHFFGLLKAKPHLISIISWAWVSLQACLNGMKSQHIHHYYVLNSHPNMSVQKESYGKK